MAITSIDDKLCNGCGICVLSCPVDVIRLDKKRKKAVIKYQEDCMCCTLCEVDCPARAIYVSPEKNSPLMVSWC